MKPIVIPAQAGIQRNASARHITTDDARRTVTDSYARYRSRWIPACAGMTVLLLFPHLATAQPVPTSLFLTPQESRAAETQAAKSAPAGQGDISLGAILFYAPDDWTLWLRGERWTPQTTRKDLRILTVTATEVRLLWQDDTVIGSYPQTITLHPHQSYQIATGKVMDSP